MADVGDPAIDGDAGADSDMLTDVNYGWNHNSIHSLERLYHSIAAAAAAAVGAVSVALRETMTTTSLKTTAATTLRMLVQYSNCYSFVVLHRWTVIVDAPDLDLEENLWCRWTMKKMQTMSMRLLSLLMRLWEVAKPIDCVDDRLWCAVEMTMMMMAMGSKLMRSHAIVAAAFGDDDESAGVYDRAYVGFPIPLLCNNRGTHHNWPLLKSIANFHYSKIEDFLNGPNFVI